MNRLLNRKKTDDSSLSNSDGRQLSSPTPPLASPGLKKSATSRWKKNTRNVKEQPEPKPEIDLSAALPSNDDFRTSLLMANLSQRFSMLREQDNPGSLVGKASDDSVLEPSRRSRMLDFGFGAGGLTDIEEVRSINSSVRPPFASEKHQSFRSDDGYASETDSHNVMARSRPGEGNTMFGGRQKVYMIPKNGAQSTKSLGKFLYDDDVGMSAFQKHRQRERELQAARDPEMPEDPSFDFGLGQADGGDEDDQAGLHDSVRDFSNSPSLSAYDKKRSTSSTARSEARSSTAATSITSQPATSTAAPVPAPAPVPTGPLPAAPLDRTNTKSRRLYEQGLDQHMQDQQSSALSRLNSIQRQRPYNNGKASPPFLHSAKSTGNLTERVPLRVYTSQSSPPVPPAATFGTFAKTGQSPLASGPNSPMSPTMEESSVLNQALEPADRGKATAMGAFNKPKHAFDEQQYMERQLQLQRSNSSAVVQPSMSAFQKRMDRMEQTERERSASNPVSRSRSTSGSKPHEPAQAFNTFHQAAAANQSTEGAQQPAERTQYPDTHRTFFGNISASDSEDEGEDVVSRAASPYGQQDHGYGQQYGRWQPTVLPSVSEHPALRNNGRSTVAEEPEDLAESTDHHAHVIPNLLVKQETEAPPAANIQDLDSPTLGPTSTEGLGSMMHHLRNKSNSSSNYPQDETSPMPDLPTMPDLKNYESARQSVLRSNDSESRVDSSNTNSNPWDLEEHSSAYYDHSTSSNRISGSPIDGANSQAGRASSRAPSSSALPNEQQTEAWPDSEESSWQAELTKQHTRNISTATQQERAAFDNELAARRRAIQENVKSMVDADHSRNPSPAPTAGGAFKAFNMLRSKSSRDSMDTRKDAPPKAMKMLGIGSGPISASTSNLHSQYERGGKSLEMGRARGDSTSRAPSFGRMLQQSDVDAKRERAASRTRGDSEASRTGRPVGRSPASSDAGRRGRSNSEATHGGRSRSTTGPYRDDLGRAMAQGTGTSASGVPDLSPMITRELTPRPSPNVSNKSSFETKNRSRSGSRTGAMTNYFESKTLQASQGAHHGRALGPSPAAMASNSFLANGGRGSPYMQAPTPPISGPNTPGADSPTPPPMPPGPKLREVPLRKKTINKRDISEPVALLSSTSNVDTIDLPEGASLTNGMDEAPPLPPINPRRRATRKLFGLGRSESDEITSPSSDMSRSRTPDPWGTAASAPRSRNTSNPPRPFESSPALQQYGFEQNAPPTRQFSNAKSPPMRPYNPDQNGVGSPERVDRAPIEGGFI